MNNGKKACFCGAKRCSGEIGGKLKDEEVKVGIYLKKNVHNCININLPTGDEDQAITTPQGHSHPCRRTQEESCEKVQI